MKPTLRTNRGPWLLRGECELTFGGPLHVGSGEEFNVRTDSPLLLDAEGAPWLRGSSVRGVLRDWCEREAPLHGISRSAVGRLFGVAPLGTTEAMTRTQRAALDRQGRLTVFDVKLAGAHRSVRDHVRIDRRFGAATRGAKFDEEAAHACRGTLTLSYEGDSIDDEEVLLVRIAADALSQRLLSFGAKSAWGFGVPAAGTWAWLAHDRNARDGLSGYLTARLPAAMPSAGDVSSSIRGLTFPEPRARDAQDPSPWSWLRLDLTLQFDGPMIVADEHVAATQPPDAAKADAAYRVDANGQPYLPGSSIRSVLRTHAERIAAAVNAPAVADRLFGNVGPGPRGAFKGLLRVGDACIRTPWHHVVLNHVAIDRVTGFAIDRRLFSAVALASPRFDVEILVRWRAGLPAEREREEPAAIALLLFVLRDAAQEQLWMGSRTSRGYGHLKTVTVRRAEYSIVSSDGERMKRSETESAPDVLTLESRLVEVFQAWGALLERVAS